MQLVAFPGFGYQFEPGRWRIQIAGVVRQPYAPTIRKRMLLKILSNMMGLSDDEILSPQYFDRLSPFVSDGAGGQQVMIRFGNHRLMLPKPTKSNGHFSQILYVPDDLVQSNATGSGPKTWINLQLHAEGANGDLAEAAIHLVPRSGLSIISDIDDTIKESAINDRRELLANTFVRPFRSVEGMADVYRRWQDHGTCFHYISSSPWQLLTPLSEMLESNSFPQGSIHLRYFRLRNHMLQKMVRIKRSGKITSLRRVVESMPDRRFVLIGDSGEKDLELYRNLGRKYPDQVLAVFIRNLADHPLSGERINRVRNQLSRIPVRVFTTAGELASLGQPVIEEFNRSKRRA